MEPDARLQHPDRLRWNEKHARAQGSSRAQAPVDWLTRQESLLRAQPRGRALDIAAGRGRNALYLAGLGFAVDAVDVSDTALAEIAREVDPSPGTIECYWQDLTSEALPKGPYEVIIDFYYLDRRLWPELAERLAPGGLLIVEVLGQAAGGTRSFRICPGEFATSFPTLEILESRDTTLQSEDMGEAQGRQVSSLVARKPTNRVER